MNEWTNELLPRKMFSQRLEESPEGQGTVKSKAQGKAPSVRNFVKRNGPLCEEADIQFGSSYLDKNERGG